MFYAESNNSDIVEYGPRTDSRFSNMETIPETSMNKNNNKTVKNSKPRTFLFKTTMLNKQMKEERRETKVVH